MDTECMSAENKEQIDFVLKALEMEGKTTESTRKNYTRMLQDLARFSKSELGDRPIKSLTKADIENFYDHEKARLSDDTLQVREFCSFGCDMIKNACREKEAETLYAAEALIVALVAVAAVVTTYLVIIKRHRKPNQDAAL